MTEHVDDANQGDGGATRTDLRAPHGAHVPLAWVARSRAMWSGPGRRVTLAIVVCGAMFDLLVRQGAATVSGTVALLMFVAGIAWAAPITRASARVALGSAAIFAVWLTFRTSDWLVPLDVLAVVLLVLLAVVFERTPSLGTLGFVGVGRAWTAALGSACASPIHVATLAAANVPEHTEVARRRAGTVGRGLLFATPVVLVVTALLASADGVFRSFLHVPVSGTGIAEHLALVVAGTCIAIVPLVRMRTELHPSLVISRRVALPEVGVVLGALVGVYALFGISQATALVRGDAYIQRTTGLTYAEYARRGYFQLLVVASISALVLLAVHANASVHRDTATRVVRLLAATAALLTILIVATALRRLALYDSALGSTMLRLACSVFACWMAVVFLVLGGAFVRGRRAAHNHLPIVLMVTAFVTLIVWNAMNPEAYVVRHNIARGATGATIDVAYLASLSDDATPSIVASIGRLTPVQRDQLLVRLCTPAALEHRSPAATNLAHSRARDALDRLCHG